MAAQLTQEWTQSTWERVSKLLACPPDTAADLPAFRRLRQRQRRLSREQMDQVVEEYVGGLSAYALGKKYGIDPDTVLRNVRARGVKPRPASKPALTGARLEEAMRLREQGWSYRRIGGELGVSGVTVRNTLGQAVQGAEPPVTKTTTI